MTVAGGPVRLRVFARPRSHEERGRTRRGGVVAPSPAELPERVPLEPEGELALVLGNLGENGGLRGCLACGHLELYTRKDFPRAAGVALVVIAAVLAPFTSYLSLVVAALIDAVLYHWAPDVVVCYACASEHRGFPERPRHPRFDREIEERLRYGQRAVMGKPPRPAGTADAPDPEH